MCDQGSALIDQLIQTVRMVGPRVDHEIELFVSLHQDWIYFCNTAIPVSGVVRPHVIDQTRSFQNKQVDLKTDRIVVGTNTKAAHRCPEWLPSIASVTSGSSAVTNRLCWGSEPVPLSDTFNLFGFGKLFGLEWLRGVQKNGFMSKSVNRSSLLDRQQELKFFTSKKKGKLNARENFVDRVSSHRYIAPDPIDDDEEEEERTVDLTQRDIRSSVDIFSAQKRFDLELPLYGPYCIDYIRNGRFVGSIEREDFSRWAISISLDIYCSEVAKVMSQPSIGKPKNCIVKWMLWNKSTMSSTTTPLSIRR